MDSPGSRIRRARKALGLSQTDLAKCLGVSSSTLSELEGGQSKLPSLEVGYRMAEILQVPLKWIVFGDNGEHEIATPMEAQLLAIVRELPEDAKAAILATAKALAKPK